MVCGAIQLIFPLHSFDVLSMFPRLNSAHFAFGVRLELEVNHYQQFARDDLMLSTIINHYQQFAGDDLMLSTIIINYQQFAGDDLWVKVFHAGWYGD